MEKKSLKNISQKTRHGWDDEDIEMISTFLVRQLLASEQKRNATRPVSEFSSERHINIPHLA